jgi:multicomponent Na+:H+ antiporter subunit B
MLNDHIILRLVSGIFIPFIILYSLYIQINGESSPGGGFQAGAIMASGLIVYDLIFGKTQFAGKFANLYLSQLLTLGVFIYAGIGLVSMLLGGQFLDYDFLASNPHKGQHLGIFIIEIGVGITVMTGLLSIYKAFRTHSDK